jgi:biotin carboxyl carrier protein
MIYKINVENMNFEIEIGELTGGTGEIAINGKPYKITIEKRDYSNVGNDARPVQASKPAAGSTSPAGAGSIMAPIPGLVLDLMVNVGDRVEAGQTVVILEAMKMENSLVANAAGKVKEIKVRKGAQVNTGDLIMIIG